MTNKIQLLKDHVDKSDATYKEMKADADKNVSEATIDGNACGNVEKKPKETI